MSNNEDHILDGTIPEMPLTPGPSTVIDHNGPVYLKSSSMMATRHSMALVSTVLGFDIVELWSSFSDDDSLDSLRCTYVHASPALIDLNPSLITGNYRRCLLS